MAGYKHRDTIQYNKMDSKTGMLVVPLTIFKHFDMSHLLQNLIGKTVEKYGQIDCVINNAGYREYIMLTPIAINFSYLPRGN